MLDRPRGRGNRPISAVLAILGPLVVGSAAAVESVPGNGTGVHISVSIAPPATETAPGGSTSGDEQGGPVDTALRLCRLGELDQLFQHLLAVDPGRPEFSAVCECFHPNADLFADFFRNNTRVFHSYLDAFMTHPDWFRECGLAAARIFERVGTSESVPPLLVLLEDGHPEARAAAARALGKSADRAATEHLVPLLLRDTNDEIRHEATLALERLGWKPQGEHQAIVYHIERWDWEEVRACGPKAVGPLLAFMKTARWHRQVAAVSILGDLGAEKAFWPLMRFLWHYRHHEVMRPVILQALSKIARSYFQRRMAGLRGSRSSEPATDRTVTATSHEATTAGAGMKPPPLASW